MRLSSRLSLPALFATLLLGSSAIAQDAKPDPASAPADPAPAAKTPVDEPLLGSLPSGALAFAETSGLGEVIIALKESELWKNVTESEQYKEFLASEEGEQVEDGTGLAEFMFRMDLWEASEKLLGGRAAVALYPKKEGNDPDVAFLIRPANPATWFAQRIWTDPLLGLTTKRYDRKRFSWGLKVYQPKNGDGGPFIALHKHWIVVTTNSDLLEKTISLQITEPKERKRRELVAAKPLKKDPQFAKMSEHIGADHLARALVDLKSLSKMNGGRFGLPKKLDNPLASLVGGGIVELAAQSQYGAITLNKEEAGFVLEAGFDGDPRKLDKQYQVFFSEAPKSGIQALPEVPGLIGGFTAYRDFATWYRSRDELMAEAILPEFDKFEAGLGNFLPGKDVGEDVLPLLAKNITFVSALQNYKHLKGSPGVKLPGFAAIIDLNEAQEAGDIFQLFFQTLLSVLNFEAGEQGRQPWLIDVKMHGDVKISTARYLENPKGDRLPIVFNFLPASARVGDKYIVSSSLQLCEQLVDALKKPPGKTIDSNLLFEVRFDTLAQILEANAEHFIAQRVEEGRTAKQAEADVTLALTLIRGFTSLSASTSADEDGFKLKITGEFKKEEKK